MRTVAGAVAGSLCAVPLDPKSVPCRGRKLVLPDRQSVFVNFVRCVVSARDRSRTGAAV